MAANANDIETSDAALQINLFATIKRRWEYVAFGTCLGIALAALYFYTATPMYQSDIEILVGQRSSELTNSGTISGAHASGDAIHEDQLATHMRLFVGRSLLAEAIRAGKLNELASFRHAASEGINLIDYLHDNLTVKRGGEGSARDAMVLRASFRDPSPADAATVLTAVYESYRNYVESHSENSSDQAVQLIEDARETHEKELATADDEYRQFIQSVPALIEGDKLKDVHKDRMEKLETELNTVRNELAAQKSRLEVIEAYMAENPSGDSSQMNHLALLSQKEVERLKLFLEMTRGEVQSEAFQAEQPMRQEAARVQYNRLLELIQKERALSDAFGANHPLVDMAKKEIEITRQFMETNAPNAAELTARKLDPAEMLQTYTQLLRNDISELEKRKTILIRDSEEELQAAKLVENDFMRGTALRARLSRAQARYDQVILRLQELNLSKSYAGFSTDLLAKPEVARNAAWPKLPILGALGLLMGLCMGVVMAIGADLMDGTFNNAGDIESVTGANVIAHVPRFSTKAWEKAASQHSAVDASIVSFHSPRSAEAEIYRVARTSLLISNRKEAIRTMMMTSPQPGDGKSTTISNLAVSFARAGKRVLLIDADLRRPMISKLFGLSDAPGLADLLLDDLPLSNSIFATELPNLSVMPHGRATSEPAELLESARMAEVLTAAKQHYDLVLVDAPPLLAVADPAIIAPLVDSVILTVRVCKNGRRPVENAIKILTDIDIQANAVIVNGVERSAQKSYYGRYLKDQYGYVGTYHSSYAAVDVKTNKEMMIGTTTMR
ncbi:MAG: polysaccharide biosynthesis tyrosine autokinase [Planctomycetaceae bacterium]